VQVELVKYRRISFPIDMMIPKKEKLPAGLSSESAA